MAKLKLIVKASEELIEEAFSEIDNGSASLKAARFIYHAKQKMVWLILKSNFKALNYWVTESKKGEFIFEEEGSESYIYGRYDTMVKFLGGSSSAVLKKEKELKNLMNDRMLIRVRKLIKKGKNSLISKALREQSVQSFFLSFGITIDLFKE